MLSFHPHVACCFAVFLSGVLVMVLMRVHVVAYIRVPMVVMTILVITMVIMIVAVFVAVFVTMVMMVVVCTTHCRDGNCERFHIFCFEFEHVFSCFKFVD